MKRYSKHIIIIFIAVLLLGKVMHCANSKININTKQNTFQCNQGTITDKNNDIKVEKENITILQFDILYNEHFLTNQSIYKESNSDSYTNHAIYILDCNLSI